MNTIFKPQVLFIQEPISLESLGDFTDDWEIEWTRMKSGEISVNISFYNTPRLQFSCFEYNNAIFIQGSPPPGSIIISVIESKELCFFKNQQLEPYELIILRYGEEMDYIARTSNAIFTFAVEEQYFLQSFFQYFGMTLKSMRSKQRMMLKEKYLRTFIFKMREWLYYFKNENRDLSVDIYHSIEQNILQTLFSLIYTTDIKLSKERLNIAKVRDILHDNIDNIYTISDLISELQISPRSLQQHFKNKLGYTPKEYLHKLRLNAIRKELIEADSQSTMISDIALKYGFFHPSHFGAQYKKIFGETPSQTLGTFKK